MCPVCANTLGIFAGGRGTISKPGVITNRLRQSTEFATNQVRTGLNSLSNKIKQTGELLSNQVRRTTDAVVETVKEGVRSTGRALETVVERIGTGPLPGSLRAQRGSIGVDEQLAKGKVALDNNALIAAIEKGEASAVDAALAGRTPIVSRQAVREFLVKGDKQALREFLRLRGGSVSKSGTEAEILALQNKASSLGRSLKPKDAKVAASAQVEGVPLITRDKKLRNFLNDAGLGGEEF